MKIELWGVRGSAPTPLSQNEYREKIDENVNEELVDTRNYSFTSASPSEEFQVEEVQEDEDEEILDTDSYVFDTDVVKSGKNTGSFLSSK